jgi:hypothetical protein
VRGRCSPPRLHPRQRRCLSTTGGSRPTARGAALSVPLDRLEPGRVPDAACGTGQKPVSEEQLAASATATYGSIRATFNHLVLSDGRYLRRLAGGAPAWVDRPDDADLDDLAARAEEAGQL